MTRINFIVCRPAMCIPKPDKSTYIINCMYAQKFNFWCLMSSTPITQPDIQNTKNQSTPITQPDIQNTKNQSTPITQPNIQNTKNQVQTSASQQPSLCSSNWNSSFLYLMLGISYWHQRINLYKRHFSPSN